MRLRHAADGSIQVLPLANHNLAGWYDQSVTPGQDGTSIILGHVDSFTGRSVFYDIKDLTRGKLVEVVRADGRTAAFSVDGVQEVAKATFLSRRSTAIRVIGAAADHLRRAVRRRDPPDLDNIVVYTHLVG